MIPLIQTITIEHEPLMGNCWQTAIASVLDLPLEEVPHFVQIHEDEGIDWWWNSTQWLSERGYDLIELSGHLDNDEYYFVTGISPRGNFLHVVIFQNGKMIHDPHPSQAGVLTEQEFEIIRKRP